MGRKIPAKKHRGVKDPLVQQARRLQSLKGKINAPPKDPDDQPVPKSLTRLFAFQNRDKTIKKKKKKYKKIVTADGAAVNRTVNPIVSLKKLPGESGRQFSLRINSAVKALHSPPDVHNYPDDVESEDEKGERMSAQRERRRRKRSAASARASARAPASAPAPASRAQRRALKRQEKRTREAEEAAWRPRRERVPFGDVAHAPPRLAVRTQPAQRGLLLGALLGGAAARGAERRERARLDAVAAYRALKTQRAATRRDAA